MLTREKRVGNFSHALGRGAGSAVAFCLAVTVIWPVGALLAYHMRVSDLFFFFLQINEENSPSWD
jgi:palmitoyltransferase ZDHHC9/14/18